MKILSTQKIICKEILVHCKKDQICKKLKSLLDAGYIITNVQKLSYFRAKIIGITPTNKGQYVPGWFHVRCEKYLGKD
jgi:hypothetical protein